MNIQLGRSDFIDSVRKIGLFGIKSEHISGIYIKTTPNMFKIFSESPRRIAIINYPGQFVRNVDGFMGTIFVPWKDIFRLMRELSEIKDPNISMSTDQTNGKLYISTSNKKISLSYVTFPCGVFHFDKLIMDDDIYNNGHNIRIHRDNIRDILERAISQKFTGPYIKWKFYPRCSFLIIGCSQKYLRAAYNGKSRVFSINMYDLYSACAAFSGKSFYIKIFDDNDGPLIIFFNPTNAKDEHLLYAIKVEETAVP